MALSLDLRAQPNLPIPPSWSHLPSSGRESTAPTTPPAPNSGRFDSDLSVDDDHSSVIVILPDSSVRLYLTAVNDSGGRDNYAALTVADVLADFPRGYFLVAGCAPPTAARKLQPGRVLRPGGTYALGKVGGCRGGDRGYNVTRIDAGVRKKNSPPDALEQKDQQQQCREGQKQQESMLPGKAIDGGSPGRTLQLSRGSSCSSSTGSSNEEESQLPSPWGSSSAASVISTPRIPRTEDADGLELARREIPKKESASTLEVESDAAGGSLWGRDGGSGNGNGSSRPGSSGLEPARGLGAIGEEATWLGKNVDAATNDMPRGASERQRQLQQQEHQLQRPPPPPPQQQKQQQQQWGRHSRRASNALEDLGGLAATAAGVARRAAGAGTSKRMLTKFATSLGEYFHRREARERDATSAEESARARGRGNSSISGGGGARSGSWKGRAGKGLPKTDSLYASAVSVSTNNLAVASSFPVLPLQQQRQGPDERPETCLQPAILRQQSLPPGQLHSTFACAISEPTMEPAMGPHDLSLLLDPAAVRAHSLLLQDDEDLAAAFLHMAEVAREKRAAKVARAAVAPGTSAW